MIDAYISELFISSVLKVLLVYTLTNGESSVEGGATGPTQKVR